MLFKVLQASQFPRPRPNPLALTRPWRRGGGVSLRHRPGSWLSTMQNIWNPMVAGTDKRRRYRADHAPVIYIFDSTAWGGQEGQKVVHDRRSPAAENRCGGISWPTSGSGVEVGLELRSRGGEFHCWISPGPQ